MNLILEPNKGNEQRCCDIRENRTVARWKEGFEGKVSVETCKVCGANHHVTKMRPIGDLRKD